MRNQYAQRVSTGGSKISNAGYAPTYGADGLNSTAGSAASARNTPRYGGTSGRTSISSPIICSGMSDYDVSLRQNYNRNRAGVFASNEAKKENYLQAMDDQTQANYDKQVKQTADMLREYQLQSIPMAQRATSENAHGSRQHLNHLRSQIDATQTKLDQMNGFKADKKSGERKWYNTALDMANHAAGLTVTGVTGVLDTMANTIPTVEGWITGEENPDATFTGQLLSPITSLTGKLHDYTTKETNASANRWRDDLADDPKIAQLAAKLSVDAMAIAPYMTAAFLTGGGSLAGETTTSATGATVLNGAGNVLAGRQVLGDVASLAKDPKTILQGARIFGEEYYDSLARGATEEEARNVAGAKALTSIVIDEGTLGSHWPQGATQEGAKSVIQGVAGELIEKAGYDHDKKWFGWKDDAVIDPVRAAKEFVGGAITSGISSGVSKVQQNNADIQAGKEIKSNGKVTQLLQDALEMPGESKAHKLASEMSSRLEEVLLLTGMDVGDLYHMSPEDQKNMIEHVIDRTLTDREVGELLRILVKAQ